MVQKLKNPNVFDPRFERCLVSSPLLITITIILILIILILILILIIRFE